MGGVLKIIKRSITDMKVDCIVNAANRQLQHGGGVCGAIFEAAGPRELQKACDAYGYCDTGKAVMTPGFKSKAKYIIHAVGPKWGGGSFNEENDLYSCYQASMLLAHDRECRTVAFPLISSGIYGYPVPQAWEVAIRSIQDYLDSHPDFDGEVYICVRDDAALQLGTSILQKLMVTNARPVPQQFQFFWHEYEDYGVFSQWFDYSFEIEGIRYANAEQYMMAKKALLAGDLEYYALIMHEPNPQKCKKLGKDVRNLDVAAWSKCKEEVVYHANLAKFSQNEKARTYLLSTGNKIIAEASPYDTEWGIGLEASHPDSTNPAKWKGKNLLGKVLMRVRDELREKSKEGKL